MSQISGYSIYNYVPTPTTLVSGSASTAGSAGTAGPTATSGVATKTSSTYTANAPLTTQPGSTSSSSSASGAWTTTTLAASMPTGTPLANKNTSFTLTCPTVR